MITALKTNLLLMHDKSMNTSLINLTRDLAELETKILQADGEITPETELLLAQLTSDISKKVDNYDLFISGLKRKAEFYKAKAEEFARAQKTILNFVDRMRDRIKQVLPLYPNHEIKGEHAYYKLVTSGKKLVIDDESKLPSKYKITVSEIVPDKELIKSNLEDGILVDGAHLEDIVQLRSGNVK